MYVEDTLAVYVRRCVLENRAYTKLFYTENLIVLTAIESYYIPI